MAQHQVESARTGGTSNQATQIAATPEQAHQLALQCHGDAKQLGTLLAKLPTTTRNAVIAEAQKLYGNSIVQQALKASDTGAPGGQHESHATPPPPPKSQSHVSPTAHLPSDHGQHESHATPPSHGHESHATPHTPMQAPAQPPPVGDVTFEKTQSLHFYEGDTVVAESVSLSLTAGQGPVHFAASDGALTVGDETFHLSLKDGKAVTGHLSIPSVRVANVGAWSSKLKIEDGYFGVELGAAYVLQGKGWNGTMSVSAFIGLKPVTQLPPDEPLSIPAPSLRQVIEACEVGLLASIAAGIATGLIVLA